MKNAIITKMQWQKIDTYSLLYERKENILLNE